MDPSTSPAQDVQNQKTSDQQINRAQQPSTATQPVQSPSQPRSQVSVGNIEAGAATIIQESSDVDAEEDEIKVAPQEMKSQAVSSGGVEDQDEVIEVQPSIPDVVTGSAEVEKIIERSPDQEKPEIPQEVKDAGVTHSGPGVIDVEQNDFGVKKMPAVTFPQAIEEEKRTKLHDSKHWYMAMVMYIWRKLNPKMGEKNVSTEKKTQADQEPILPTKTVEEPED